MVISYGYFLMKLLTAYKNRKLFDIELKGKYAKLPKYNVMQVSQQTERKKQRKKPNKTRKKQDRQTSLSLIGGRVCYGLSLSCAKLVMGRVVQSPNTEQ